MKRRHVLALLACFAASALAVVATPAFAVPVDGDPPPPNKCLDESTGSLATSARTITPGQSVTLTYDITAPNCLYTELISPDGSTTRLTGTGYGQTTGSITVTPGGVSNVYQVRAVAGSLGGSVILANAWVSVQLGPSLWIGQNNQRDQFIAAINRPGMYVSIDLPARGSSTVGHYHSIAPRGASRLKSRRMGEPTRNAWMSSTAWP
jgi:hypothetical protein